MAKIKRGKWFVCKNTNGVHYPVKNEWYYTIFEFWDKEQWLNAVYGPCPKKDAIAYAQDLNHINAETIDYNKPKQNNALTTYFDDDDDDYMGIIT